MVERERQTETTGGTSRRPQSRRRPDVGEAPADPERIRILAYEIYETRQSSGMLGDPVSDWLEAERRLNEPAGSRPARKPNGPGAARASEPSAGSGTRKKPSGK